MPELLIYKSKVQEIAKREGFRIASDFYEALSKKVEELIMRAIEKARAENKKTLSAKYLE